MGRWKIVDRRYHNEVWDIITVEVSYRGCVMVNEYLIRKHEKTVPRALLEERKWGQSRRKGSARPWKEGRVKPKPRAPYKPNRTEEV
jgi:hypothetical protein